MINCKIEFLEEIGGKQLLCAKIERASSYWQTELYCLSVGFTEREYAEFLNKLDFKYDDGYGRQEVSGLIWYKDGTWSERGEDGGREWWQYKTCPDIPECLKKDNE